jgi:plastocyanin
LEDNDQRIHPSVHGHQGGWGSWSSPLARAAKQPARSLSLLGALVLAALFACDSGGERVNECERDSALDRRSDDLVEIRFGGAEGERYDPSCVRVRVGTRVRFVGRFDAHPLSPGRWVDDLPEAPLHAVIQPVGEGREATFIVSEPGAHGYLCDSHVDSGMLGAIFAE